MYLACLLSRKLFDKNGPSVLYSHAVPIGGGLHNMQVLHSYVTTCKLIQEEVSYGK